MISCVLNIEWSTNSPTLCYACGGSAACSHPPFLNTGPGSRRPVRPILGKYSEKRVLRRTKPVALVTTDLMQARFMIVSQTLPACPPLWSDADLRAVGTDPKSDDCAATAGSKGLGYYCRKQCAFRQPAATRQLIALEPCTCPRSTLQFPISLWMTAHRLQACVSLPDAGQFVDLNPRSTMGEASWSVFPPG